MRTLVLSLGNTSLFGGVFSGARLMQTFRMPRTRLPELPHRVRGEIDAVALCSVVPDATPRLVAQIRRRWQVVPRVLTTAAPHGLTIGYRRPRELGSDRLATALGARALFPRRHLLVVDCGTATTITAVSRVGQILGGAIFPGATLWAQALATGTAQLPLITPRRPRTAVGRSPAEAIGSGLFFGQLGAIHELVERVRREAFGRAAVLVIGTGGHAPLFESDGPFDVVEPNLLLLGLRRFAASRQAIRGPRPRTAPTPEGRTR